MFWIGFLVGFMALWFIVAVMIMLGEGLEWNMILSDWFYWVLIVPLIPLELTYKIIVNIKRKKENKSKDA
jgi:hypothetical protein